MTNWGGMQSRNKPHTGFQKKKRINLIQTQITKQATKTRRGNDFPFFLGKVWPEKKAWIPATSSTSPPQTLTIPSGKNTYTKIAPTIWYLWLLFYKLAIIILQVPWLVMISYHYCRLHGILHGFYFTTFIKLDIEL